MRLADKWQESVQQFQNMSKWLCAAECQICGAELYHNKTNRERYTYESYIQGNNDERMDSY